MNHSIRYAPPGEFLAEITQRCLLGFFLLKPSKRLNDLVAGVVAKAQQKYPVKVVGLSVPSNHYHLLATATSQQDLSEFMNFVASNVAREAGREYGWKGRFWSGRYDCTPITEEETIQVARLKYILSQGCKEGLVASPRSWPGINCAKALMTGTSLQGVWIDRTALYNARRRKGPKAVRPIDFHEKICLEFVPLPCWAHLAPEEYQARVRNLVEQIEEETAAMHRLQGTRPLGRRAVLRQDPLHRPRYLKTAPSPRVHAATAAARKKFLEAYRIFVTAFRAASARFRNGEFDVKFPEGSFPPARRFIRAAQHPGTG